MDDVERLAEEIEPFVDRHGMAGVLEALAVLAALKAEHVQTNWGDRELARTWARTTRKIDQVATATRKEHL